MKDVGNVQLGFQAHANEDGAEGAAKEQKMFQMQNPNL